MSQKPLILPLLISTLTLQLSAADQTDPFQSTPSKKMTSHTNRLAQETSPYLLQHATNPVDWYPWGEEAFAKARKENKLIFLSSGYSTCHWCHVMERESFKNKEIAALINKHFVAIKLDREERPDVDQIYMTAHSAMSGGSGGWPLNMFLLPDLKPVYGGTYFPPAPRQGRPSFPQVLEHLGTAWEKNPADLTKSATDFTTKLNSFLQPQDNAGEENPIAGKTLHVEAILSAAQERLMGIADLQNGGLGQAPKFPQVSTLRFLLHSSAKEALNFVLHTCDIMQDAGIHDQIGGGFHRYATDEKWLIPHFEKMLYDQAQLIELYLDAALLSPDPQKAATYNHTARKTAQYILSEMTDKTGGFYSAQDAQSEGKEGKYFCWTTAELKTLLSEDEFAVAQKHYGLTDDGNFLDFSDPEALPNLNILSVIVPLAQLSERERTHLATAQETMTTTRAKKVPPMTDQKILSSWNGLTIGALARAAHLLDEPTFLEAAEKAHHFITAKMWNDETQHLHHCSCDGKLDSLPQAESHLYLLRGTRQLYEATLDPQYLAFAIKLADATVKNFHDGENGGFYNSAPNPNLIMRLKGDFDGATPTVSSVAALEYLLLAEITGRADYKEIGENTLTAHKKSLTENPSALAEMLVALPLLTEKPATLLFTEGTQEGQTPATLLKASHQTPNRQLIRLGQTGPVNKLAKETPKAEKPQAILCKDKTCLPAIIDETKLKDILHE